MDRRTFLTRSAVLSGSLTALGPLHALGIRSALGRDTLRVTGYGPLVDKGDLALPEEFNYQIISRQGMPHSDGTITAGIFDGMAAYPGPGGTTILIRNHENRRLPDEIPVVVPQELAYDPDPAYVAGCSKLVVCERKAGSGRTYEIVESFNILGGTDVNCAGGIAPPQKWVTCEEIVNRSPVTGRKHGYVFEINARGGGPVKARPIRGAGRLVHEAAVWFGGALYQTEDRSISVGGACLYRYIPKSASGSSGALAETAGVLEALKLRHEFHANMNEGRVVGMPYPVEWVKVDDPDHEDDTDLRTDREPGFTPTRYQAQDKGAAFFERQEGMWVGNGRIYFDCTSGGLAAVGQVWEYNPGRETITLIFESPDPLVLESPDNVVIVPQTGDIFLQEDSAGEQFIRGLTLDGAIYEFARTLTNFSEFAGGTFSPDGQTLYVNQQGDRGPTAPPAVTYAIYGPFQHRH